MSLLSPVIGGLLALAAFLLVIDALGRYTVSNSRQDTRGPQPRRRIAAPSKPAKSGKAA